MLLNNIGNVCFNKVVSQEPKTHDNNTMFSGNIGIFLDRSELLLWSIYICFKNKLCYLPLDTTYPQERIDYIIKDANINTFITSSKYINRLSYCENLIIIDEYIDLQKLIELHGNNDVSYILYTSGTTGKPKGVEINRDALYNFIEGISDVIDFSLNKRIACLTTVSFDIFFLESIMALFKGLTVVLANKEEQYNPKLMAKFIEENNIEMLQITPSRMQLLLNHDKQLLCLKNVKEIMIGGEPFPLKLLKVLQEKTTAKIYNMYGPTETTIWSCISELTNKNEINIGKPIKETQIYILDENHNLLSDGEIGEIGIAGKGLAKGYYSNDKLTNEKFICLPGKPDIRVYLTGDIGRYLPDGNIEYVGRNDNQIKIRGYRIELEEIESILLQHDLIDYAVVSVVESDDNKFLIAFYNGNERLSDNDIKQYLKSKLPEYMIPVKCIFVQLFPFTHNGKIDRHEVLNKYLLDKDIHEVESNELKSIPDKVLAIINKNVDNKLSDKITFETEFSSVGIDSITFIKIVVALEEEFNFEFDDEMLLFTAFKTITNMSDYIVLKTNSIKTL